MARFAFVSWDLIKASKDLSKTQLRVMLALLAHAKAGCGKVWPSQSTLATMLEIDRRHVQRALRDLEALGYILGCRRAGMTTEYAVAGAAPEADSAPPAPEADSAVGGGAGSAATPAAGSAARTEQQTTEHCRELRSATPAATLRSRQGGEGRRRRRPPAASVRSGRRPPSTLDAAARTARMLAAKFSLAPGDQWRVA